MTKIFLSGHFAANTCKKFSLNSRKSVARNWLISIFAFTFFALPASANSQLGPTGEGTSKTLFFSALSFKSNPPRPDSAYGRVRAKIAAERPIYANCDKNIAACPIELRAWRVLLQNLKDKDVQDQIAELNTRINIMVRYQSDKRLYGRVDYWASPRETLSKGGDCEDIALLKYESLRALGFGKDVLRLVILKNTKEKNVHAVVTVELNGVTYALDSLQDVPVEARNLTHYQPVFSLSGAQRWIHVIARKRSAGTQLAKKK